MLSNLKVRSLRMLSPLFLFRLVFVIIIFIGVSAYKPGNNILFRQMPGSEPNNNLPAKVLFLPMIMKDSIITKYYIKEDPSNGFGYFVFQPIQENATKWKDKYILIAYAYTADGKPMHDFSMPLKLVENENGSRYRERGQLNLGNLILNRAMLKKLYKDGTTGDLYFAPRKCDHINYVGYDVSTNSIQINKFDPVKMDPCPPASCTYK